jgi:hypothetical protein
MSPERTQQPAQEPRPRRTALPAVYGLDLVTDASGPLVDPFTNRIVAVGLSSARGDERFDGDERELLAALDTRLMALPAGVVVTWHGSVLAIPLLAARARAQRIHLGLVLEPDRRSAPPSPVRGVETAVRSRWGHHAVLDLQRVYEPEVSRWRLRRRERDPETLIPPTDELTPRDPCRDARLARSLTERRWSQARRHIDSVSTTAPDRPTTVGTTAIDTRTV